MIVYAINIHSGGGKVLLDEVLEKNLFGQITVLFLDARYKLPQSSNTLTHDMQIFRVQPTLQSRWYAEYLLKKISQTRPEDSVLCFGNLPPLFRLKNKTILYLQNAFLLPEIHIPRDSLKTYLRFLYERLWLKCFSKNVDSVFVQTKWMQNQLPIQLKQKSQIQVIAPTLPSVVVQKNPKYLFLAITGNENHKNLKTLLETLKRIDLKDNRFAIVTTHLCKYETSGLEKNVHFIHGSSRQQIFELYQNSKCLIMTSEIESFCLPLYEAKHFGLDIIATDVEFTHEAVKTPFLISKMNTDNLKAAILNYMDLKKLN